VQPTGRTLHHHTFLPKKARFKPESGLLTNI
jgi:hypothetical protein